MREIQNIQILITTMAISYIFYALGAFIFAQFLDYRI